LHVPTALTSSPQHAQVIQRIGHWLLDSFGTAYIVPGFTPEALLALGFWPGAAQKDFTGYWAERFHVAVPAELIYRLLPGLDRLEAEQEWLHAASQGRTDKLAEAALMRVQLLRLGAVVVVQDALELADRFPRNPIHAYLLGDAQFRCELCVVWHQRGWPVGAPRNLVSGHGVPACGNSTCLASGRPSGAGDAQASDAQASSSPS
jgi:hypothetical protein